jgi:capsular polysaccharide transport system permease protein
VGSSEWGLGTPVPSGVQGQSPWPDSPMTPDDEFITAAEAADLTDPRNAAHLLRAAELCLPGGDYERAARLAGLAAALTPGDARPARVLSGIRWAQGHQDEAIEAALEAVRLAPAAAESRLHAASLLAATGQWRQVAEHLALYVAGPAPRPVAWRLLSSALQEMGRTPRALEAIDQAILLAPEMVEYRIHRGSLLAASGRYGDALAELGRAAELAPDNAAIWRSLSGVHEVLREYAEALANAERAAASDPANPDHLAHLNHVRALLGLEAEQAAGADARDTCYWTQRPERRWRPPAPPPGMIALLGITARILFAIILREMRTRFGRARLGYVWALLEPISHIATLGSVFSLLNHAPPPVGDHLFLFYLTGLLPFLMFGHVISEVTGAFAANAPVLQIPLVKRIDVILARSLLSLANEIVVGIVVFGVAGLIGWQGMPADLLTVMTAICMLWLVAVGIGALNIVLVEFMPGWDTFFNALIRVLYFASGIYYSPIAMPSAIRAVLVYNPVLQANEWFRSGFYAGYQPHWLDRGYVVMWALGALLVGLAAERAARRFIAVLA